tara:strand:- start:2072 stop:2281 length:210 start_codon:yes stop_codon:yes gene_type:complete
MDYILSQSLPPELVYVIMKDIHKRYMLELEEEIKNNIVWIKTAEGVNSFLVGKTANNPFYPLRKYIDYL